MNDIVVVDSGIDGNHPALRGKVHLSDGPTFGAAGATDERGGATDHLGHGTAVAATIVRFLQRLPIDVVALRVFERQPVCDFAAVLHALRHALSLRPRLINLSLGTTSLRYRQSLLEIVAVAAAQGTRIVAPASYGGLPCDPGNLAGVEAVVADPNVLPMLPELRPYGGRFVWFAASQPPPDADGVRRLRARGDSLATASVTGCLARSLPA
jgi:subtilisin family serine protease